MLISLLVTVIILGLIFYALQMLPLPQPFKQVALVVFIIICILVLVGYIPGVDWPAGWGRAP